jgi:DNA-binding NtrC family response regulator
VSGPTTGPNIALSAAPPPLSDEARMANVLVVDDEPALRRSLARVLETRGMKVAVAEDGAQALEYIRRTPPDVALVDMMMPGVGGLEVLSQVQVMGAPCEVILMTAFADVDSAVAAMKAGAYHFLTKPFHSNDAVAHVVAKAAEHRRLAERARRLEQVLLSKERFGEIIGDSPKILEVFRLIDGVGPTSSTVMVLGESGTGKELVARAIHQHSPRSKKPFVAVNCGAIPKELVESELFGHVRGAFTGAQTARAGLFETADSGTILLDEVGDLPLAAQVKLLRVLQEGEIKRVGADESRNVDVRVIAATNVDLLSRIQAGQFRRDLYYRLHVITIELPALRDRGDDVLLLANYFLQKFARSMQRDARRLSPDAVRALLDYDWPGNVRELEHAIEHAMVLAQKEIITAADLPFSRQTATLRESGTMPGVPPVRPSAPGLQGATSGGDPSRAVLADLARLPYAEAKARLVTLFDETYTGELLRQTSGNMSEAARRAGLDRSNFRRLLKRHKDDE